MVLISKILNTKVENSGANKKDDKKITANNNGIYSMHDVVFYFGIAQETEDYVQQALEIESLVLLKQTHSIKGHVITEHNYHVPARFLEGDFLVTNVRY